jgi:hypothetical protein
MAAALVANEAMMPIPLAIGVDTAIRDLHRPGRRRDRADGDARHLG